MLSIGGVRFEHRVPAFPGPLDPAQQAGAFIEGEGADVGGDQDASPGVRQGCLGVLGQGGVGDVGLQFGQGQDRRHGSGEHAAGALPTDADHQGRSVAEV